MTLYLDGVLQPDTATSQATGPLRNGVRFGGAHIGGFGVIVELLYGGYIDEARISSGVLAPSEFLVPVQNVPAMNDSGRVLLAATIAGLAAWTFRQRAAAVLRL